MDQWIEAQKQARKLAGARGQSTLSPKAIERLRSLGSCIGVNTYDRPDLASLGPLQEAIHAQVVHQSSRVECAKRQLSFP